MSQFSSVMPVRNRSSACPGFVAQVWFDGKLYLKGLSTYRPTPYKDQQLLRWVFARDLDLSGEDKSTDEAQRLIDIRLSVSAILSGVAYAVVIGSFLCDVCKGVGSMEAPDDEKRSAECTGKWHTGTRTKAQMGADKLLVSLTSYYRKCHEPYEQYYWFRLMDIETHAIMHVEERFRYSMNGPSHYGHDKIAK